MTHYLKTEMAMMRAFESYWQKKRAELSMVELNSPEFHIAADAFRNGYDAGFEAAQYDSDSEEMDALRAAIITEAKREHEELRSRLAALDAKIAAYEKA